MAGHVQDIINSADDPKISILIAPGSIAGEIFSLKLAPILFFVALLVPVNRAQHRGPRSSDDELTTNIRRDLLAVCIDHRRVDTKKGQSSTAGLCRNGSWQRRDHDRSSF